MHDLNTSGRILVFAKAPISGSCKTRLGLKTGMNRAARIHKRLVHRTLITATNTRLSSVELHCAPGTRHPYFQHLSRQFSLPLRPQTKGDLGTRMQRAMRRSLMNSDATIIIGTDCPALLQTHLEQCFRELHKGIDAVFIPTTDGGYALIGLRRACPRIFSGIARGTDRVMGQTRSRLRRAGLHWTELPQLYDIDEYSDYLHAQRLYADIRA